MHAIDIRQGQPDDIASIEKLYPAAFPEEDLLPLVRQLLAEEPGILSLVAEAGDAMVGHILFTPSAQSPAVTPGPPCLLRSALCPSGSARESARP